MKKTISSFSFVILLGLLTTFTFTSCGEDDDAFNFPLESLYGTWKAQEIQVSGTWYNVTREPYTRFGMSITFYEDGRYYGTGYFGDGGGTYKAIGNNIITYFDGVESFTYTINSLSEDKVDLNMSAGSESLRIRAIKQ